MTPSFDPSPLIPYIQDTLGLQYHYVRADIVNRATKCGKGGQAVSSLCAFCARYDVTLCGLFSMLWAL
jgi:hypothetical protein